MFGDRPFFGGSIFETPAVPQPTPQPAQPAGAQYSYGAAHSGIQFNGGGFSGYVEMPNQGLQYFDRGHRIG